ncbi:MAG TPA: 30S ribosomal protein S20 [Phycisphaerae bacterium]|nr:30S ribosomal protein S20 [Phycisphaerae bacterium]
MARSLSSQKRLRQNKTRAARNQARKSALKTHIIKVRDALASRDVNAAMAALHNATQLLDRAANKGTIHRNTAARRKSRMMRRLNTLKTAKK